MEVDLTNRGVAELEFCAEGSSVEESAAALQVKVLRADHNRIQRIVGLSSVFSNLVALHLSGNRLGSNTTAPKPLSYSTVAHFQEDLCDGMAPWLAALPSSLEYIDVSKNEILSLCCCVCGSGKAPNRDVSITDLYFHHALPLSLSVFFSSDRFPHLKRINLSHNRLESVSGGGQAEEGVWNTVCAENGTTKVCTAESIDVSYNPNVKTLDGILWATDCLPLQRISCEGCGIDDLRGLAAVPTYCPMVSQLLLRGSTLSSVFFSESPQEVRELLEANLPTLLSNKGWTAEAVNHRIDEPTLEIIDSTVKQYIQDTSRKAGCAFPSLSFALYAFFCG
ncbi:hypothetical protein AGDE_14545 [Angomonas deanei]|uniref:Leucine Rich repeat n=1 Tax=Angomonas deanei TaxID=59799 RepID=A0A7G2C9H6_9TRYP|nr:hypothetical protein AGDE_14545 [Angomonas deanei]CAD2216428.1 hypothetical protein, conserved [Angomonas deanei]|eukprot:EPY20667.1 hypothetical protein AGDE_14545 [Angomonas deanei]